jgi:hypothetical protein
MNNTCETKESCMEKIQAKLKGSFILIIGIVIGGIAGFMYYKFIGCSKGTCPITSSPWISTLWGAIMGYLIANIFHSKPK